MADTYTKSTSSANLSFYTIVINNVPLESREYPLNLTSSKILGMLSNSLGVSDERHFL